MIVALEKAQQVVIRATDMESYLEYRIPAQVQGSGTVIVSPRGIVDWLSSVSASNISLELSESGVTFNAERLSWHISSVCSVSKFPPLPVASDKVAVLPAQQLQSALRAVEFSAGGVNASPALQSICFCGVREGDISLLTLTATDDFRLSRYVMSPDCQSFFALVPCRTIDLLLPLLKKEPVSIFMSQDRIAFESGNATLFANLCKESYPLDTLEQIIAAASVVLKENTVITVSVPDFLRICKAVKAISVKGKPVTLHIKPGADVIAIAPGDGTIPASHISGPEVRVKFNLGFLIDLLTAMQKIGRQRMEITINPNGPCLFRPVSDKSFFHILMPMKEEVVKYGN